MHFLQLEDLGSCLAERLGVSTDHCEEMVSLVNNEKHISSS